MQRVLVTVARAGDPCTYDLELPADVEAGRLAAMIAEALQWTPAGASGAFEIATLPQARPLGPHETLADAGVWDGATLTLTLVSSPLKTPALVAPANSAAPDAGPLLGWSSLPQSAPSAQETEASSEVSEETLRFVWKQLDG